MKMTRSAKLSDFSARQWYLVDAKNVVLGKLATRVADVLRGKGKPIFSPHVDCGDHVVIINADKIHLTGEKMENKVYRTHSGWLGHLKTRPAKEVLEKCPEHILKIAIYGMLPKNRLRHHFMSKLHIYAGAEHKQAGQNPIPLSIS